MLARVATVAELFDQLCLRWAREADLAHQERGQTVPTLVVLPRDPAADEVAIQVDGLRGYLAERAPAILADLRPVVAPHDPAGLVFVTPNGVDGVAVYVTLGTTDLRRAVGLTVVPGLPPSLTRAESDPDVEAFTWLDALLTPDPRST